MHHSQEAASVILAPHLDTLGRLFPSAWDSWEQLGESCPELRMQMCKRTRASLLSDFAVAGAQAAFADHAPAVTLHDKPGFLLIGFSSQLSLRLKKYRDGSFQTSGIPTHQRRLFEAQQPLPGMEESTNLVLGYILNQDASGIASTAIKCSMNGKLQWAIDVPLPEPAVVHDIQSAAEPEVAEPGISSTLLGDREEDKGIDA